MKKLKVFVSMLLAALLTVVLFSGCTKTETADYTALAAENQRLTAELAAATETVNTKVTGTFVADVRQVSPGYTLDAVTPTAVMLTCFQDSPFMVIVGEELASKLTAGKAYYFELEEKEIGKISKAEFEKGCPNLAAAFPLYNLQIKSFRLAQDDERGLESVNVTFAEVK